MKGLLSPPELHTSQNQIREELLQLCIAVHGLFKCKAWTAAEIFLLGLSHFVSCIHSGAQISEESEM